MYSSCSRFFFFFVLHLYQRSSIFSIFFPILLVLGEVLLSSYAYMKLRSQMRILFYIPSLCYMSRALPKANIWVCLQRWDGSHLRVSVSPYDQLMRCISVLSMPLWRGQSWNWSCVKVFYVIQLLFPLPFILFTAFLYQKRFNLPTALPEIHSRGRWHTNYRSHCLGFLEFPILALTWHISCDHSSEWRP